MTKAKKGNNQFDFKKPSNAPGPFPIKGSGGVTARQTKTTNDITGHCVRPMKRWLEVTPEELDMEIKKLIKKGYEIKLIGKGSQPCFKRINYLKPR